MTAVVSTTCSNCGVELTNQLSKLLALGTECRKGMSQAQLIEAIRRNTPGAIPPERAPSRRAKAVNAAARRAARPPAPADLCGCGSGSVKGRCPACARATATPAVRRPVVPPPAVPRPAPTPANAPAVGELPAGVARIIQMERAKRAAARDAAYDAWMARHGADRPAVAS